MPVVPTLNVLKQENCHKIESSLGYIKYQARQTPSKQKKGNKSDNSD